MDDFNPTKFDGLKLVVFRTAYPNSDNEVEAMSVLGALEPPRRQGDLLGFVVANPTLESIERTMLLLPASEYKIGDEDAVKLYWSGDLKANAIPPSIQVQFVPGERN